MEWANATVFGFVVLSRDTALNRRIRRQIVSQTLQCLFGCVNSCPQQRRKLFPAIVLDKGVAKVKQQNW
ncbi:MAG: hypothetical protein OXH81_08865, partial [Gemmatimonadetes bacterium]|nr:hypothetical protein [Gemmatimonadota bacterium]